MVKDVVLKNEFELQVIGDRIKEVRENLGLTQGEFAKLLFIHRTTLLMYEKSTRLPNIITLTKISQICDVSLDWLCGLK